MELPGSCAPEPSLAGAQLQAATLLSRNLSPLLAWLEVDTPSNFVFSATSVRGNGEGRGFQDALRAQGRTVLVPTCLQRQEIKGEMPSQHA